MAIIGADGGHIGTVDRLEAGQNRLTRAGDPAGTASHQHGLALHAVVWVEAGRVRLTSPPSRPAPWQLVACGWRMSRMARRTTIRPARMPGGAASSPRADQGGTGTGMIHGGGTTAPGSLPGWGAGGRTAGAGFPDDPNMDRHGGSDPSR
jgi:hypothetical protein